MDDAKHEMNEFVHDSADNRHIAFAPFFQPTGKGLGDGITVFGDNSRHIEEMADTSRAFFREARFGVNRRSRSLELWGEAQEGRELLGIFELAQITQFGQETGSGEFADAWDRL